MKAIGKLRKITKELCPDCNQEYLQLRFIDKEQLEHGEMITKEHEFYFCSNCQYLENIKKRDRKDNTDYVQEF